MNKRTLIEFNFINLCGLMDTLLGGLYSVSAYDPIDRARKL